jgi:hypothetical protein
MVANRKCLVALLLVVCEIAFAREMNISQNINGRTLEKQCDGEQNEQTSVFVASSNQTVSSAPKSAIPMKEYTTEVVEPSKAESDEFQYGCSLGCAVGWDVKASASASPDKNGTHGVKELDDGNCGTAWISSEKRHGIGNKIIYSFPKSKWRDDLPHSINFSGIRFINGYIKSQKLWNEYSRVKKFRVYLNDKPVVVLNILYSKDVQEVSFDSLYITTKDIVVFEILEIYPGSKYKQVAISELLPMGAH